MVMKIAIDCMGGDHGVSVTIPAIIQILQTYPEVSILAFGTESAIKNEWGKVSGKPALSNNPHPRLQIIHTEQFVEMSDSPTSALKNKRKSSMAIALAAVKNNEASACISAGNTGALVALSCYMLKTLAGIDRPAIIAALPTINKPVYILDLGANVDCKVNHLLQFAKMAVIMLKAVYGINPTVGVLNIGTEVIKGNSVVKETIAEIQKMDFNFIGSVEGDEIFQGKADIVVCDGFVGNVALKVTEGVSHLFKHWLREECNKNIFRKISALIAYPIFKGLIRRKDPRIYNGATLLGLQGVVIKSHGGADILAFRYAIEFGINQVRQRVDEIIGEHFKNENNNNDINKSEVSTTSIT